ncbi:hypothetical protein TI05_13880 [Achromatium sp. WMS3]|nr:hypothetical protein TI03_03155 [Achromatium sp. WMS1]KOR30493.1 hypothetical protein TI05_13880 [Achromatium sp. WMS3]
MNPGKCPRCQQTRLQQTKKQPTSRKSVQPLTQWKNRGTLINGRKQSAKKKESGIHQQQNIHISEKTKIKA